ncbi:MCE family protein [Actinomadura craniellae]|uniref:MCE family protein n=1 Tax=Actinomadura craniellae TaxID=2231787 RepID=A0A365HAW6_9ACTN|nr:MlaD family protein [Actinomadura craniellae]RAY16235.1 MCE family protein [Actinomadura craniellae]
MNIEDMPLRRRLTISLATLLALAATGYALIARPFAAEGTRLVADFGTAGQGLGTSSPVKIRGVTVGRVDAIDLLPDGRARVTLRIDPGTHVPDSVSATVEPESVFGPKFVGLAPGPREATGPYLADGARIAVTGESGDLNSLLTDADRTLAAIDPQDVAVIVDALGQGLGGQGQRLRGIVDSTGTLVEVAHRRRREAQVFLADLGALAELRGVGQSAGAVTGDANALIATASAGQNRLRRTASGVSAVSALLAHGLGKHGGNAGEGFRSAERAAAVLRAQLGIGGPAVRTLTELLPYYRAVGWAPGPDGTGKHMLAVQIMLPTDPCELLIGLCP